MPEIVYRLVADTAMVVHFAWLVFLVIGGFLAWRWLWVLWIQLPMAAWGFGTAVFDWGCPLTTLENWARERAGQETLPATGFIDHYIAGVVYPGEDVVTLQILAGVVVVVSWIVLAVLVVRRRRADAPQAPADSVRA